MQVIGTYADVCLLMRERMLTLPAKRASVLVIGCNDEGTYFLIIFPCLLFQVIGCNDENREPIKLTAKGLTVRFFIFLFRYFGRQRSDYFGRQRFIICFFPFF